MSILMLSNEDFYIAQGAKGALLCNRMRGLSFVLFYSIECPHCKAFLPVFKDLARSIIGCQFGLMDIMNHTNLEIIRASQKTICPIDEVPFLILYYDNKPYMRYKGPLNAATIKSFIFDVSTKIMRDIKEEERRKTNHISATKSGSKRPQPQCANVTIGIPIFGDRTDQVSYITFDDYDKLALKTTR